MQGTLGQFVLYSAIAAGALGGLSEVWGEVQQTAGAAERLAELLATDSAIKDPENPKSFGTGKTGRVSFQNVGFSYPTRPGYQALEDVSFEVNPGETVAIVGSSGSGKSTLFNLILRFYDADTGTIKIDGLPVTDVGLT